jgi:predicted transcriptional regulator of viral defense system
MDKNQIIKLFQQTGGYMNSASLVENKVHTSELRSLVEQGLVEQVKRGFYRLPPEQLQQHDIFTHDYFDAALAIPRGVFCLTTALFYYELTTSQPTAFDMAIPRTNRKTDLSSISVRFYRFYEPYYSLDVKQIDAGIATI